MWNNKEITKEHTNESISAKQEKQVRIAFFSMGRKLQLIISSIIILTLIICLLINYITAFHEIEREAVSTLLLYAEQRVKADSQIFQQADDSVTRLKKEFLFRFSNVNKEEALKEFDELFMRYPDGIWRVRPEVNDPFRFPTMYMQYDADIDNSAKIRTVVSYHLFSDRGTVLVPPFYSLYMDLVECGLVVFSNGIDWGGNATRSTNNYNYPSMALSRPDNNPERKKIWTPVYFDSEANMWMVSVIEPVDWKEQWFGDIGHNLTIDMLMKSTVNTSIKGSHNIIISQDGQLIAHPELLEKIDSSKGDLSLYKLGDPFLNDIFRLAHEQEEFPVVKKSGNGKYWVSIDIIQGPEWFFFIIYPRDIIVKKAINTLLIPYTVGFIAVLIGAMLVSMIMNKMLLRPLSAVSKAASGIAEKIEKVKIPVHSSDEIGQLARTFEKMTERVYERENSLQESEARFRMLFHSHDAPFLLLDPERGKILDVNISASKFYGYSQEEMRNMFIHQINIMPPERVSEERINAQKHARNYFIFPHKLKSGEIRTVEVYSSPVFINGKSTLFSIIHDITDRKKMEDELRLSEERLSLAIEGANLGVWDWHIPSGRVIFSRKWAEMLGYQVDELVQDVSVWQKLVHPEDWDKINSSLLPHLMGETFSYACEHRLLHKKGYYIWVLDSGKVLERDEKGKAIRAAGIHIDITEHKTIEEKIHDSEEKFRTLFENMTEGVALHKLVHDSSGKITDYRIIDVNAAYEVHTGFKREEVIGKLGSYVYGTNEPPYLKEFSQVALTRIPYRFDTYFDSMKKHFLISVVSPKEGQFATVFEDITESIKKEEELRQKNEELAQFIYTVSHDLKSPLVTIRAFSGYLREDINKMDYEAIEKDLGFISNASGKMGTLLDELLELSRIGRIENPRKEIMLQKIVKSAVDLVAGRLSEKKIKLIITEEPIVLFCDQLRLTQLFQNLIDNAAKFIGDKENPCIEIGYMQKDREIVIFVRDNGSGIDPRYAHKVFGLFEKLNVEADGTGIGLALAKRIVEIHNGKIWFESEGLDKGTTFFFTLDKTRFGDRKELE